MTSIDRGIPTLTEEQAQELRSKQQVYDLLKRTSIKAQERMRELENEMREILEKSVQS